jgi:hypothetical protein
MILSSFRNQHISFDSETSFSSFLFFRFFNPLLFVGKNSNPLVSCQVKNGKGFNRSWVVGHSMEKREYP